MAKFAIHVSFALENCYLGSFLILLTFLYFQIIEVEWEVDKTEHFRTLFFFSFNRVFKAAAIDREICTLRGKRTMPQGSVHCCFLHLKHKKA